MDLEVCAYSLESCMAARRGGATRVELCASPFEGGTTPSAAAVRGASRVLKEGLELPALQLYVMVRPRGGDFLYTPEEFAQMEEEIEFIKRFACDETMPGVDGVVFGLLQPSGNVDVVRTRTLVERAKSGVYTDPVTGEVRPCARLGVTFHRAFDMSSGAEETAPFRVLEEVIATGADRILTSGFHPAAIGGREVLRQLVIQAAGRIEIMAGCGVGAGNAEALLETGADALHMSGKATRESGMKYRNPLLSMGGVRDIPEYDIIYTDQNSVKAVRNVMDKYYLCRNR